MASNWALARAADHLFGDNLPSGAEVQIERLAALLDEIREHCAAICDDCASSGRPLPGARGTTATFAGERIRRTDSDDWREREKRWER